MQRAWFKEQTRGAGDCYSIKSDLDDLWSMIEFEYC